MFRENKYLINFAKMILKNTTMKKILLLCGMMACLMAQAKQVVVETARLSLVLDVTEGKTPQYVYFGSKLSADELSHIQKPVEGRMDAYPAYGLNCPAEPALAIRHADGNMSTALAATGVENVVETTGTVTRIHLLDAVYNTAVDLCYKSMNGVDMIEVWTEISNG